LLEEALRANKGSRPFREWKAGAAEDVVTLAEQTSRLGILSIRLDGDLRLAYEIQMPVPGWPVDGRLVVESRAMFHLSYREAWRWQAPPGWAPLILLQPAAFHPNVRPDRSGIICLGHLPAGIPPREIVLLGYFALSLQTYALNEMDAQGVLNPLACAFYREHPELLPLTRKGLLDPWPGEGW
jgi:hypothetical protein